MPRKAVLTLDDRIKRAEAVVAQARARYEDAKADLQQLREERENERREEVFAAISRSKHSYAEILAFIRDSSPIEN